MLIVCLLRDERLASLIVACVNSTRTRLQQPKPDPAAALWERARVAGHVSRCTDIANGPITTGGDYLTTEGLYVIVSWDGGRMNVSDTAYSWVLLVALRHNGWDMEKALATLGVR